MGCDVLVLNTAVVDFRHEDFGFVDRLVGRGGLAKCPNEDRPSYTQRQYKEWIDGGFVTAGGPGNTAPLMAKAGLKVAVGANLGKGDFYGLDAQGRYFYDVMVANGIDMSGTHVHPDGTGTTFIHVAGGGERGGISYFPGANDDFDFAIFRKEVERLEPRIVYYMYSGLSARGDSNGGRDLAEFIRWCRGRGAVTIVDSHTLTGDPEGLIKSGRAVKEYKLLEPLLGELDIFFTSSDEAKMIENTLRAAKDWDNVEEDEAIVEFLEWLCERFWTDEERTRLFGVTVSDGAYHKAVNSSGETAGPSKTESRFMAGEVVDLVGAGDSFRAGLLTYIARNLESFREGTFDVEEAVQMGNLMASVYIKAPLSDRYKGRSYEKMLSVVRERRRYKSFEELEEALS